MLYLLSKPAPTKLESVRLHYCLLSRFKYTAVMEGNCRIIFPDASVMLQYKDALCHLQNTKQYSSLCRLSQSILQDNRLSALATALYCFNPASVFHSAAYTESLFAAASFAGMWYLHHPRQYWVGVLCFALGTAVRSNGLLNAGFILHLGMRQLQQGCHNKVPADLVSGTCCLGIILHNYVIRTR